YRPGGLNDSIDGGLCGDSLQRTGNIIGGQWLEEHMRQPHLVALRRKVGDLFDELEELRRAHNRVRNRRGLDEFLLREFGAEVPTLEHSFRPDHGQRDVMTDARRRSFGEEVLRGRFEEFQHGRILPGWRVGYIHYHRSAFERMREAFAGNA